MTVAKWQNRSHSESDECWTAVALFGLNNTGKSMPNMTDIEKIPKNNKEKRASLLFYLPALLLLFMMFFFPDYHHMGKYILAAIIFIQLYLIFMMSNKIYLHRRLFHIFIFYVIFGGIYGIYGSVMGNPGVLPVTRFTTVYVLIYLVLISGVCHYNHIRWMHYTLVFLTIFLSFYITITILNAFGYWPDALYYEFFGVPSTWHVADNILNLTGEEYGKGSGFIDTGFASMPSFLFLQPYLVAYLLTSKRNPSFVLWAAVIFASIIMMFTGRRTLLIIALIFPVIIVISLRLLGRKNKIPFKKITQLIIIAILALAVIYLILLQLGFDLQSYLNDFFKGFSPTEIMHYGTGKPSITVQSRRWKQISILWAWWLKKPLFGFGSGAVHEWYARSGESGWKFEMIYSQFLVNWGLVGCICYAIGIFLIFKTSVKIYKEKSQVGRHALAASFGMLGFLAGTATNPYLLLFDYMVVIFIPSAIINYWLINRNKCPMCQYDSAF